MFKGFLPFGKLLPTVSWKLVVHGMEEAYTINKTNDYACYFALLIIDSYLDDRTLNLDSFSTIHEIKSFYVGLFPSDLLRCDTVD